jgi:IS5 family transposase
MASERFIETGKNTFYGEYIYDRVVPKDHFFRKLNAMLDWRKYTQKMMRWYKGRAEYGRPPFDPAVLLKMLLVAYLYNLSERQTEQYINDSMSAKYFLGLGMDQFAPDHSTLTKFKRRMIERKRALKLKAHVSMNSENHLITSVITTPGNAFDGHFLQPLIEADLQKQVPMKMVAADRGYDDSRNHYWLERTGIQSAICLNDYRTQKKDSNKEIWQEMKANPMYLAGLKERYKIERKFGKVCLVIEKIPEK